MPGMAAPLRVTPSPSFFEDHPGSAELWSPGSPLFPAPDGLGEAPSAAPVRLIDLLHTDRTTGEG